MVDLLSARLADYDAARVADPAAVIRAWRTAMPDLSEPVRDESMRIAAGLGASQVLSGSVVGSTAHLVVNAAVRAVPSGEIQAQASVAGPIDSITVMVDRLAVQLLAGAAGEGERLARSTTLSVKALRAYLDGEAASRRGAYHEAVEQYEAALTADSAFALAALHLAVASDRLNQNEQHNRALALAWAGRGQLSDRDRAHLTAFVGPHYPALSSESEQLAAWERAVALAPDRADVWYELGEHFYYDGGALGLPDPPGRAAAAFRRALELDPGMAPARRMLIQVTAERADTTGLGTVALGEWLAADSAGDLGEFLRWRIALARRDAPALRSIRARLGAMPTATLRAIAMTSQFDGVATSDAERAINIYRERARQPVEKVDAFLAQHSLALNAGRPILALDVTEQLQELQPGSHAHLRLRVLDAIYGNGDDSAAVEAVNELTGSANAAEPIGVAERAGQLADLCVVEQWRLAHGIFQTAGRAVDRLRAAELRRVTVQVGTTPMACAELLDAWLAVASGRSDATRRVQRLDSLMLTGPALDDASTYSHLVVARLYGSLRMPDRALAAIRRRQHMTGWPRYLATTWREEARLAYVTGDYAGAARAYERYIALRPSPEARLAHEVAEARAALARLGAQRPARAGSGS